MRRINDFSSIKQLLFDIHRDKMDVEKESDNELQVICPSLPSFLVSKLSSSISVGVYPCGEYVMICFDKL